MGATVIMQAVQVLYLKRQCNG